MPVKKIQIGAEGLNQKLFAILRKQDREINYIQRFIKISKEVANASKYQVVLMAQEKLVKFHSSNLLV
jgi:hypothetical protein